MDNQVSIPAPAGGGTSARPSGAGGGQTLPARRKLYVILLALVLMVAGAYMLHSRNKGQSSPQAAASGQMAGDTGMATPVRTATVQLGSLDKTIALTGNISALQDVQLSSKITGRVLSAGPLEGSAVTSGQVVVQLDSTDLQANVRQDQAAIQSAQSQVAQAVENYQMQVTQAKQNVVNARAAVAAAQQNYLKLARGNRPQQILEAKSQLLAAHATTQNALTTLNEDKTLYAEGAIAKNVLDTAQTTYNVDLQQELIQKQAYSLQLAGYQSEDVRASKEQVREAEANLRNQIANERQVSVRRAEIQAAQALVAQDRAKMAYDQQQVAYCSIRSPIDGLVAARNTQAGQMATPGTSLMRIVDVRTVYFQPTTSDTDVNQVSVGMPVTVRVDGIPAKTFSGRVAAIYPAANMTSRLFTLRVNVDNPTKALRPGMFARGPLTTRILRDVPVVPTFALVPATSQSGFAANASSNALISKGTALPPMTVVVVGPNSTAEVRPVTVGMINMQQAAITSGLNRGEQIVVEGQQTLKNGSKVVIEGQPGSGGASRSRRPASLQ